jgi:hypothetical protein
MITAGVVVLAGIAAGLAWKFGGSRGGKAEVATNDPAAAPASETSLRTLSERLRQGDGMALAVLIQRMTPKPGERPAPVAEEESSEWNAVIAAIRSGFPKFSSYGRASAVSAATRAFNRFAVEPAPADWISSLGPIHEILVAGLSDKDPVVRVAALTQIASLWTWAPGRDRDTKELEATHAWKDDLVNQVVRLLSDPTAIPPIPGDPEPKVRAAAVTSLAALLLDNKVRAVAACAKDPATEVRAAVLDGFAGRRMVLSEEAILPLLYDPFLNATADQILRSRGLTPEQIGLGKLIVHPDPQMRISAIGTILSRSDIDPTVWLLFLSHDADASVRAKVVETLAGRDTPEVRKRLTEMAESDASDDVRQAAAKVAPPSESTALSLPPLPGSASLNLKAN